MISNDRNIHHKLQKHPHIHYHLLSEMFKLVEMEQWRPTYMYVSHLTLWCRRTFDDESAPENSPEHFINNHC